MPRLQANALVKSYKKRTVVNKTNIVIENGEIVGLLGPNGAGKTTTIKMLVGLLRPSSGVVRVCGHDLVKGTRSAHRHVGYVPDEPYLYDKLTGHEFLRFIADMYGIPRNRSDEYIAREIDRFELHEFANELAENYSLGMRQRLVFAAAFLHDPDVLVLDEPMVGLDPRSVRIVKDLLKKKTADGMTVFMSTHTLGMAEEMASRMGIMVHGNLKFLGTVSELREQVDMETRNLENLYLEITSSATRVT